jgi:hypothetical protein
VIWFGDVCVSFDSADGPDPYTPTFLKALIAGANYTGATLMPGSLDDTYEKAPDMGAPVEWVPTTAKPIIDIHIPQDPYELITSDDKVDGVEIEICEIAYLRDGLTELMNKLMEYKLFQKVLNKPLTAQAYVTDVNSDKGMEFQAIYKLGDVFWHGTDEQGPWRTYVVPDVPHEGYEMLVNSCELRGGHTPEIDGFQDYANLMAICAPDQLACGRLLVSVKARGCSLYWGWSQKKVHMHWTASFKARFCDTTGKAQREWNVNPYMWIPTLPTSRRDYWLAFNPHLSVPFLLTRSLCYFPSTAPISKFTTMVILNKNSVNRTLDADEDLMMKLTSIQKMVKNWNIRVKKSQKKEDCAVPNVSITKGSDNVDHQLSAANWVTVESIQYLGTQLGSFSDIGVRFFHRKPS